VTLSGITRRSALALVSSAALLLKAKQAAPWSGKKKLLAIADPREWYGHVNYHHDSASHTLATVEKLGRESGAWITVIRTDMELLRKAKLPGTNARTLDDFDAIFYMGEGPWDISDEQKANLLSFVRDDGKGFVAGHAGNGGHLLLWPEYAEMIGGNLVSEFPTTDLPVILEDPKFPGVDGFSPTFWYRDQFTVVGPNFSREVDHVIMRLDATKLDEAKKRAWTTRVYRRCMWGRLNGRSVSSKRTSRHGPCQSNECLLMRQRRADRFPRRNPVHKLAVPNNKRAIHQQIPDAL
jgi:type 1 glutamine amidotransferase